jgi:hypothetical protein
MAIYNWYHISPLGSSKNLNWQKHRFSGQFELRISYGYFKCIIWVYNLCRIVWVIDWYDLNWYRGTHESAGAKISVKLRKISNCMAKRSTNQPAKTYILIPSYDFFKTWFFVKLMVHTTTGYGPISWQPIYTIYNLTCILDRRSEPIQPTNPIHLAFKGENKLFLLTW